MILTDGVVSVLFQLDLRVKLRRAVFGVNNEVVADAEVDARCVIPPDSDWTGISFSQAGVALRSHWSRRHAPVGCSRFLPRGEYKQGAYILVYHNL